MTDVESHSERELVARLKRKDADAFDQVFAAYHARMFSFLARLTRRRDVAEELTEELWLRVVAHAPRLRDDTHLTPWLFTVARNLFASYCRSRALPFDAMDDGWLGALTAADPSPFEAAAATELQQRVEMAMSTLPGRYREALVLVAIEGLSPAEAAGVCGVSPEAMRQRLSRGRALLAKRLEIVEAAHLGVLKEVCP